MSILRALLFVLAIGGGLATARAQGVPGEAVRIEDRLLVRLLPSADPVQALDAFVSAFQASHPDATLAPIDAITDRDIHLLSIDVPAGTDLDALELDLQTGYPQLLVWGEWLYDNDAPEGGTGSTWVDGTAPVARYTNQYPTTLLRLDEAHARSTGTGVVVAVLDTGIDAAHPALSPRILPLGFDFVDGDADPSDVGDGQDTDGDGVTDEMVGHGTFVAGLVILAAPEARILPIRVLNGDGTGDAWTLARGLFHAIDHGVEVINLSLRSTYNSAAVEDAYHEARMLGIVVVAAAGNFDRSEPREFPAMTTEVLGVAATDDVDVKAPFSNFGDRLFISAPGGNQPLPPPLGGVDPDRSVYSTIPGGGYGAWEGTSMATPLVAGAAALIRAQHPEWAADVTTVETTETRLATAAVPIDALNPAYAGLLGAGRLDAGGAALLGPPAPPPADIDHDGMVGVGDLLRVLADWGLTHTSADQDGDGNVGTGDLLLILAAWGT